MSNDILDTSGGDAVGGLSAFRILKNTEFVKNASGSKTTWTNIWKHRGGLTFWVNQGKKTGIIFLTDIKPIFVHEVAVGERTGDKGKYPLTDFARSMTIDGFDPKTNKPLYIKDRVCLLEKALGRGPKVIWVAKIMDLTPFKTKTGEERKWSIKTLVIPSNSSVLEQLIAVSGIQNRNLQYAKFSVQRTMNEKSPRIGDSWTFQEYVKPEKLVSLEGFNKASELVDIDQGYPAIDAEMAVEILGLHKHVCDKFTDKRNALLTYNEPVMETVLKGEEVVDDASPAVDEVLSDVESPSGLESLEDIPTGNPFAKDEEE